MSFWRNATNQNLTPIKYTSGLTPDVLSESTAPDYEFDYIDIGSVTLEAGVGQREKVRFEAAPSRARKPVREGDVIISTVRTYLKAVAYIGVIDDGSIVSTGFAVLRPNGKIDSRFLYRVIQSNPFVETVQAASTGVSYPAINPSALGSLKVPLPEINNQKAIAAFLDRETARIDQLIEKKERFLELIEAKRRTLVAKIVDGSLLHGEANDGPTGWFGRLPDHWKVRRARILFRERIDLSEEGSEELLTVSHITGVTARAEKDVNMFLAETLEGYKVVRPGDLVVNTMWAWMGAMGVSPIAGCASPSYAVYRPHADNFISPFLDLLVRSAPFVAEVNRRSKGVWASRLRLYPDAFLDIPFPVPPLHEQEQLVTALNHGLACEEMIAAKSRQSLMLLRERRAALITAAITGQIQVRGQASIATAKPDRAKFRVIVGAEIVHRHQGNPKFGRVKLQKELYLAEAHIGINELEGNYLRYAAGPYDEALIQETERGLETAGFYRAEPANRDTRAILYAPLANAGRHTAELKALLGPRLQELQKLIALLCDFDKDTVEAIATLYAVWNDALMDGESADDTSIMRGFLTEWHRDKERFKEEELRHWLAWMRRNGLVPRGQGPRTAHTMTRDMFVS